MGAVEALQRLQQAAIAEHGVPHHAGDLDAGRQRIGGALAGAVDPPLQAAQPLPALMRDLPEEVFDQLGAQPLECSRIALGKIRPCLEVDLLDCMSVAPLYSLFITACR